MKTLADRIKSLRLPKETQAQFAERLGTTQASISRYLNGRQPDRETLIKIARTTGVTLDWLLTGTGIMTPAKKPNNTDKELLQAALAYISDMRSITGKEKTQLADVIREVVENKDARKKVISQLDSVKSG